MRNKKINETLSVGEPKQARRWAVPCLSPKGKVSASLDLVRGLAAVLVLLQHTRLLFFVDVGHVAHPSVVTRGLFFLTGLGHPSVMVFFVLSGFFISNSVLRAIEAGRWSVSWYLSQRLTRLYVVLVPALILCAAADQVGIARFLASGIYSGSPAVHLVLPFVVTGRTGFGPFLGNLLFLQGIRSPSFGSNGALWSLSYEFWYYMGFAALVTAFVGRQRLQRVLGIALTLAIGCFVGQRIATYFAVWMLGFAVMFVPALPLTPVRWRRLFIPGSLLLLLLTLGILRRTFMTFSTDITVAVAFALVLYGLLHAWGPDEGARGGRPVGYGIPKMFAGFSYTLYLVHLPILVLLHAWMTTNGVPAWQPDALHLALGFGIASAALVYAWGVAQVTEARTSDIRRAFQRLAGGRTRIV